MFCSSCGTPIPEDSRFCEVCGSLVETDPMPVVTHTSVYEAVLEPVTEPVPEPASVVKTQMPPEGFEYDPNSGLYYIITKTPNPETGDHGQWVTWFYPETGEFKQDFTPDPIQPPGVRKPAEKPAKKGINPLMVMIPVIGLLAGVLIALIQHGVFNS